MSGPCMCGGLDCKSCGPLQGSTECGTCGRLACDEHVERFCSECDAVDPKMRRVKGVRRTTCCEARVEVRQQDDGPYERDADEPDPDAWQMEVDR